MEVENMNIWCWIIPLLVGLICALLGYLLGKANGGSQDVDELTRLKDTNAQLKADLKTKGDALKSAQLAATSTAEVSVDTGELKRLQEANAQLEADLKKCGEDLKVAQMGAVIPFDADMAKSVFGKKIKENDLKVVEGIGPKIEQLFQADGITTWKDLSETPVDRCKKILNDGGKKFQVHDPTSWPLQAKMCYHNQWRELLKWQDEHKGGRM